MKTPICPTCSCSLVRLKISKEEAPSSEYQGERHYFCCQGCIDLFDIEPEKYLDEIKDFIVCPTCLAEKPRHLAVKKKLGVHEIYLCRCTHCADAFVKKSDYYLQRLQWAEMQSASDRVRK